ncbi:P-loop NTPase fold protein [Phyllobacterium sp. P30BS-XVII]|uniref:KAP family P-loop NTPase fold protein n=1 Tax=Phyllobacterium sp. P30BS-XVII TaxID=2587046 RepID=UPI0015F944C9|nr:P-loop NTPase fold protein [Phyllobacterium sp. P30BS-XVII]MBA8904180.1 hypothetical protein [Phyllobacterium sp. P30BS-XVII]
MNEQLLNADQPLTSAAEDRLGRSTFAKRMAAGIIGVPASNGFVVGIEGEWGSGKSSLIAMIIEAIRHAEMIKLTENGGILSDVVDEAWDVEKMDFLADKVRKIPELSFHLEGMGLSGRHSNTRFLDDMIAKAAEPALVNDLTRYIRLREQAQDYPDTLIVRFSPWLIPEKADLSAVLIRDLSYVISKRFPGPLASAFKKYAERVAELATVIGGAADALGSGGLGATVAGFVKWFTKTSSPNLDNLKASLAYELGLLRENKILVIIDDLDRLTPSEATQMVGLVKNLGELPNVIYLLSYDHEQLSKQISRTLRTDGAKYLEKIIQLRRPLPVAKRSRLSDLLMADIGNIPDLFEEEGYQSSYPSLWLSVISHYLKNPRSVTRVSNSFRFSYASLKEDTDPTDLFVVELIQILDQPLYDWIRQQITLLAFGKTYTEGGMEYAGDVQERWGNLKAKLPGIWTSQRQAVITYLFPHLQQHFSRHSIGSVGERAHRIADFQYSLNYFSLTAESTSWPRSVLTFVLSQRPSKTITMMYSQLDKMPKVDHPELRRQFLSHLMVKLRERPADVLEWIDAIQSESHRLIQYKDETEPYADNLLSLRAIMTSLLHQLTMVEQSKKLLSLIMQSEDISLLASVIRQPKANELVLGKDETSLRNALFQRVLDLEKNGELWHQADPLELIYFWKTGPQPDTLRTRMTAAIKRNELAAGIMLGLYKHISKRLSLKEELDKFFNISLVEKLAGNWIERGAEPLKSQSLMFLDAIDETKSSDIEQLKADADHSGVII